MTGVLALKDNAIYVFCLHCLWYRQRDVCGLSGIHITN